MLSPVAEACLACSATGLCAAGDVPRRGRRFAQIFVRTPDIAEGPLN